jgi:hypothetical protein
MAHFQFSIPRCDICDWPLKDKIEDGCIPGNCCYRPDEGSPEYYRAKARRAELISLSLSGPDRNAGGSETPSHDRSQEE